MRTYLLVVCVLSCFVLVGYGGGGAASVPTGTLAAVASPEPIGSTPYTLVEHYDMRGADANVIALHQGELLRIRPTIMSLSSLIFHNNGHPAAIGPMPYLLVAASGNDGHDFVGFRDVMFASPEKHANASAALAVDTVLLVAEHKLLDQRDPSSSGCKGADEGCLWAPLTFHAGGNYRGGTRYSTPSAASLASVLAVFPDTKHTELSRFAKTCAKKKGNGIEQPLAQSGGVGIADFTCMGDVLDAMASLPTGASTTVTIDGQNLEVSGRGMIFDPNPMLTTGLANNPEVVTLTDALGPQITVSAATLLGSYRVGDLFAAAGVRAKRDFFGFKRHHNEVLGLSLSLGHENAFLRFSEQHSLGSLIRSAEGRSVGITLRKDVSLKETTLTGAAHADRFLGGEAIIPYGTIALQEGNWNTRFSLTSETPLTERFSLQAHADVLVPATGDDEHRLSLNLSWTY